MSKRKRKAKAKPPPVIADLFDVLEEPSSRLTAPETPAAPETPERASSSTGGEGGGAGEARCPRTVADGPHRWCEHCPGDRPARFALGPAARPGAPFAVREVCAFPAAFMGGLPAPFTLRCELDGAPFVFTSARASYAAAREARVPAFVMRELVTLAHAAQNDRVPPYVFASMLARKRETPELVIELRYAFGGMPLANAEPSTCTVGEAFERMGVELVDVEVSS